jgi:hypothetical protein
MVTRRRYTHCLAGCSLLASVVLGCWLAGPAAGADRPEAKAADKPAAPAAARPGRNNGPEIADLGAATPKALVESMAKVLGEGGKPHGWLGFQPPANRALAKEQLKMTLQLGAKAKALVELVQARIGKMEAGMIKSMESGVNAGGELTLRYQMSQIAPGGTVDWDTLKITENGDKAQVAVPSTGATIQLAKVNGKWYLDQEAFAKDAPGVKEMTGTLMKVLDQVEQKVKSGEINKQNFIQQYQDIINSSLSPGNK